MRNLRSRVFAPALLVCSLAFAVWAIASAVQLNSEMPAYSETRYAMGETLQVPGFEGVSLTATEARLHKLSSLQDQHPNAYEHNWELSENSGVDVRVVEIVLQVVNETAVEFDTQNVSYYKIAIGNAYSNGVDLTYMLDDPPLVNPPSVAPGSTETVSLFYSVWSNAFPSEMWADLENEEFRLVCDVWPSRCEILLDFL